MSIRKRVISLLCAGLMLVTAVCFVRPAATYAADLDEQLEEARKEQAALEKEIESIRADKNKALDKKALMDQRNDQLRKELSLVQTQYDETTARIKDLEKQEKEQYELFCKQMRQEEERGTVSYWAVIFKATSFADLLGRIDFINEVMEHDHQLMEKLRATREELAKDKEALQEQKSELESTQQELENQIAEAEKLIKEYESTEAGKKELLEIAEEDEARVEELIREAARQKQNAAQNTDNKENSGGGSSSDNNSSSGGSDNSSAGSDNSGGGGSNSGVGGFIWPTNATRYVTCPYGYRICPFHGEEYHNGCDIGAGYGTAILAAKSGTVIQAGWNGGYGISVMIQHEGGTVTLYGHMCDWNVSAGQQVSQGQVIGWCGSTGNSTGAHIHYSMYQGSSLMDPLPYLPGYIPYDW